MTKSRKLLILALLVIGLGLGVWYYWQHIQQPPPAVRLLPEGDLILYANLKPIHLWDLSKSHPLQLESDYQDFIDRTGIQFERDLDEVAMSRRDTADGRDVESSEIFAGRFDAAKLNLYLHQHASQSESYSEKTVYIIPHEGHTVRVCILDDSKVAVTNAAASDPIHGIIERFRHGTNGPTLVKDYYPRVPGASLAWVIDRMPSGADVPQLPGGLSFGFLENTVAVASLRYNGDLLFRADVVAAGQTEAAHVVDSAKTFFAVYRTVSRSLGARGNDPDVRSALDSIHIEQNGNAAIFTAALSQRFVKKILSDAGPEGITAAPTPSSTPIAPAPKPKR